MATQVVYTYTEGRLEPLDREYFKNTLRFMPGVQAVGAIEKPAVTPPPEATLGYEVRFDDAKLSAADMEKRLRDRGFVSITVQEVPAGAVQAIKPADSPDIYTPAAPNGNKEALFRVDGLVTVKEVREVRSQLTGALGVRDFFSMVAEAADEPWAGDVGLVDVQYDASRTEPETIKTLIEKVQGLKVVGWKPLASNLNFPWPL